ncbi:serine/threonine protein kinase [Glycomyces sp. TRM65418]|uniref:serine/threonine-protein kinase n=1 Tax=Glycomyces sp. TRM65418 TaxID=2867006 RepID=UPI001CE59340|nr:serine/threonine-protein kinase [Glycomyces sp. TRM65418]MCC3762491.1 serine/threonine protein kinase [Glycomyces sp. TRM65418]QZD56535.1 serine/threonine protein kinase [Glycomyces sp. TRM65418]
MLSPEMLLGQRYRLRERVAVGGMGEVWRAEDTVLERTVAVKAMLPALLSEPGFAKRFSAEAKTVAALTHPHIVNVHDFGNADLPSGETTAYLVMEFIEGKSLADLLAARGRIDARELMPIIAATAEALQQAHERGIIHRDIKPGNILVRDRDGQAVLTDFGIARSGASGDLTATGSVMGTASYIAPEQAEGTGVLPASDMYSLGVVAFHGLTGHRPFTAENPIELALHHVRTPPPPLPPDVPPGVRAFVERSMAKNPHQRFASAADMAAAARVAVDAPPSTSVMPPVGRLPRRAGMVPMGGPPAGVAEPAPVAPQTPIGSPQHPASPPGIELGAVPPPPASKPRMSSGLVKVLAGVVGLVVLGGMVLLLLQLNGGGTPGGEETTSDTQTEETADEDPTPQEETSEPEDPGQETGGGGIGSCLLDDCDR